jgi:hypothetical protein
MFFLFILPSKIHFFCGTRTYFKKLDFKFWYLTQKRFTTPVIEALIESNLRDFSKSLDVYFLHIYRREVRLLK